ncbi:hypothetical protein VM57_01655 [Stenotrophomonas maltophilia]|uniref:Uncharacterized protein n=1 Tax=Stenotrophomonas maltophilia TaxID=40324 RepID=A0A0F5ZQU4_STEMA|nr:hypothetical protein VM57_01655 [Stenotrophomonas maltophilia]
MSLENYPRLTDSEFALFQAEAESFAEALACQGVIIGSMIPVDASLISAYAAMPFCSWTTLGRVF